MSRSGHKVHGFGGSDVPRAEGPEEFFKVLREVQQGKKKPDGGPTAEASPPGAIPAEPEFAPPATLSLSLAAAAGAVVIVLLLVVLAYLVGRQQGWHAYEAMLRRQGEREAEKAAERATPTTKASPAAPTHAAEVIDGSVFTLLTLQKAAADRESVTKEAEYLNKYAPFKVLGVEAYVWRDNSGRYRLCAKGFKAMDEATRKQVRDQIRNLVSRQGRREYRDSDFLPQ